MQSEKADLIPFIVEWIPDLLPITKMGELTLQYQLLFEDSALSNE